jgi:antitoxin (DNA-binding transcriptional repressor) of toxin-antitoxin stability system
MTIQTYDVQEAKENLPRLLEKVAAGAEVIIAEEGRPLARISRIGEREGVRFGVLKGKVKLSEDFDAPLPEEVLAEFEGRFNEFPIRLFNGLTFLQL